MQRSAGDAQMRQPRALRVPGDLIDRGAERPAPGGGGGKALQKLQQLLHALQPQRRAEQAGEQLPPADQAGERPVAQRPGG